MRHLRKLFLVVLSALSLVAVGSATVLAHDDHTIVRFSSMTPVIGAAVGAMNDRGLVGGTKAWVIESGSGSVSSDGHVMVSVTGLVIPALGNVNPAPKLKAIVSCITQHHMIANVSTVLFDATSAGNVTIDDTVALPRQCGHAIVFVTSPAGAWFAMSNPGESEESGG